MIPKIIHYCWFGGEEIPPRLLECMRSWERLQGYTFMRWDETNCSFTENAFVRTAYEEGRWAFVSDYYRLRRVYDYGGIYLDTDVVVRQPFDKLLGNKCFLGFNYDCCIGTAVFGAEKGHPLLGELLEVYENAEPPFTEEKREIAFAKEPPRVLFTEANNHLWTWNMIYRHKEILLNNSPQRTEDFVLFPKEIFEIGRIGKKYFSVHLNEGSWREKKASKRDGLKRAIALCPKLYEAVQILVRRRRYRKINRRLPFYGYALSQRAFYGGADGVCRQMPGGGGQP